MIGNCVNSHLEWLCSIILVLPLAIYVHRYYSVYMLYITTNNIVRGSFLCNAIVAMLII